MTFRERLAKAFERLRKQGLLARMNFKCCQSCARAALTEMAVKKMEAGVPVSGYVYWHGQDDARLKRHGEVFLAYGPLDSTGWGSIGLSAPVVGLMVVDALLAEGIRVEWDGDELKRIPAIDPDRVAA